MAAHGSSPEALTLLKQARSVAGAADTAAIDTAIARVQGGGDDHATVLSATLDLRDPQARAWLRARVAR